MNGPIVAFSALVGVIAFLVRWFADHHYPKTDASKRKTRHAFERFAAALAIPAAFGVAVGCAGLLAPLYVETSKPLGLVILVAVTLVSVFLVLMMIIQGRSHNELASAVVGVVCGVSLALIVGTWNTDLDVLTREAGSAGTGVTGFASGNMATSGADASGAGDLFAIVALVALFVFAVIVLRGRRSTRPARNTRNRNNNGRPNTLPPAGVRALPTSGSGPRGGSSSAGPRGGTITPESVF